MNLSRAAITAATLLVLCGPATAQQVFSGTSTPLGMCPDATTDESSIFKKVDVPEPRIEDRGEFSVEGSAANLAGHSAATFELIPRAWQQLNQSIPNINDAVRPAAPMADGTLAPPQTFALCWGGDFDNFYFMPGVEVTGLTTIMSGLSGVVVPANRYAVFSYSGPETGTGDFRWSVGEYMKTSQFTRRPDPNFEVYASGADAMAGNIEMEFWIPIER